ncbi:hypothetical protein SEER_04536 [Salmonella enterica subsp. enterica serovar Rissen str. 150]|nr:hypothetical protein SEER_04536 [Salmonella enterica subsp. enterica serovar Rissen str. 150]
MWIRFIPAGAGNTCTISASRHKIPVYPRWRGEHEPSGPNSSVARGLSPLARGTQ